MRGSVLIFISLLTVNSLLYASSFQQTMAIQHAELYGENLSFSEATRNHYVSRGQEYLRTMVRREIMENISQTWLHDAWVAIDPAQARTGIETTMQSEKKNRIIPIETKFRVYADEDLNNYLGCGRFLPIEVQMESIYRVTDRMGFRAKVEAPFDDFFRFNLGSYVNWNDFLNTNINYSMSNQRDIYNGLTMGMGFNLSSWKFRFNYDLTSDYTQLHHLAVTKSF